MRRAIFLLVLVAAGAAAAVFLWWRSRGPAEPPAFMVGLHPLSADRAVFAMRANYEDRPARAWIGLVDRERGLRWKTDLPGLPLVGSDRGLASSGEVVSIRLQPRGGPQITARYDLRDGVLLWERELPGTEEAQAADGSLAVDDRVIESRMGYPDNHLVAINAADGEVAWKDVGKEQLRRPRIVAGHLMSEPRFAVEIRRLQDGKMVASEATRGAGCVLDDVYLALIHGDEGPALLSIELGASPEPRRQPVDLMAHEPFAGTYPGLMSEACGVRNGLLVFTLIGRANPAPDTEVVLVGIDPETGRTAWTLPVGHDELGGSLPMFQIRESYAEADPLSGPLPRFVPTMVDDPGGEDATRLLVIDLDERKVVSGDVRPHLIHYSLFRVGELYYVTGVDRARGRFLGVIDGATGELTAAVRFPSLEVGEIWPYHVADGAIWVFSQEWQPMSKAPWTVLDARTLAPLSEPRMAIEDATDELRERLGLGAE